MNKCFHCGYFSDNWCSLHETGASPVGGCKQWRSHIPKAPKELQSPKAECGECVYYRASECINPKSSFYKTRLSPTSACVSFSSSLVKTKKTECIKDKRKSSRKTTKNRKKNSKAKAITPIADYQKLYGLPNKQPKPPLKPVFDPIPQIPTVLAGRFSTDREHECRNCWYYRDRRCLCEKSTEYGKYLKESASCVCYIDYHLIRTNETVPVNQSKTEFKNQEKQGMSKLEPPPLQRKRLEGERCNRCKYYNNRVCKNDSSDMYNYSVHPSHWCDRYERFMIGQLDSGV